MTLRSTPSSFLDDDRREAFGRLVEEDDFRVDDQAADRWPASAARRPTAGCRELPRRCGQRGNISNTR
jgi:hypothetical protein